MAWNEMKHNNYYVESLSSTSWRELQLVFFLSNTEENCWSLY
jgi:hypothetical protein